MNIIFGITGILFYGWLILIPINIVNAIFNLIKKPLPKFMSIFAYIGVAVALFVTIMMLISLIDASDLYKADFIEILIISLILLVTSTWNIVKSRKN